ncbi:hypothetical protein CQW23_33862 [Capsicum baccatum]|uniref:Uncharacterized protein n=1 Tax=Capsicum baccatum TaxID=33114 RepID=A0A2G2V0K5_CAPBA|nr:hypothetical protein CQW23_33862 [Capsicum baccatum]
MDVGNEGGGGGGIEVDNDIVRTLITRVDDRVRISLSGGNLNIEKIRDTRNNNNVVGEYVKRDKWPRKANPFYMNSEFLLENDILPSEINRKLKTNGERK